MNPEDIAAWLVKEYYRKFWYDSLPSSVAAAAITPGGDLVVVVPGNRSWAYRVYLFLSDWASDWPQVACGGGAWTIPPTVVMRGDLETCMAEYMRRVAV